jgi:hypothetical protein
MIDAKKNHTAPRIFVSHVSPGREPFVELIAARTGASFTVSGHMGAPACMVWNRFAIGSLDDANRRFRDALDRTRDACMTSDGARGEHLNRSFDLIERSLNQEIHDGGRRIEPRWYRGMTHINLADAHVGYSLLEIENSGSTRSTPTVTTHRTPRKSRLS